MAVGEEWVLNVHFRGGPAAVPVKIYVNALLHKSLSLLCFPQFTFLGVIFPLPFTSFFLN